jgi:hypothetical protein
MAGDSIKFNASLNTAAFESGAKKLQGVAAGAASGISQHFGKIAMAVAGITAAFLGVRAAVQSFNAAIAMGGQLNDLSARTGETAGNLAILQRAFQNAGAGAEAVGPTINRLQRAIVEAGEGSKTYAAAFQKLGLDLNDLKTKTPTEQLRAVAEAIKGIENPSEQTAIAMQILGRSGGELMPLLKAMGEEFDRAGQQLGSLPEIIDRTNGHLDRIGDNFKAIGQKGTEFMVGLLERLAPGLADLTDRLANIDAAGFGAKLSEYAQKTVAWITETFKLKDALNQIEVAISGITSGNFGDGLKLIFLTARDTALNAINQIVAAATAGVTTIGTFLSEMFGPNSGIVKLFSRTIDFLGSHFEARFAEAVASILNALPFIRQSVVDEFKRISQAADADAQLIKGFMGNAAKQIASDFAMAGRAMPEEFAKSYKANMENPLFEMKDRAAETADQMERVAAATRAAAFDAERFGQALRDAQIDRFAGGSPDSPFPANTRGGGAKMGATMLDGSTDITSPARGGGGGSSSSLRGPGGNSMRDMAARGDVDARTEMFRNEQEQRRYQERTNSLQAQGHFRSAAQNMGRADRAAERREERFQAERAATDRFGGNNSAEAFRNYLDDLAKQGIFSEGLTKEDFDKWAKDQGKPENERMQENAKARSDAGGAGADKGAGSGVLEQIQTTLERFKESMEKRLPQNSLS